MDLGIRQIRTAGKGSGSIELTLPSELRDLEGLPCRILLRDGGRPDIVLQPDLQRARTAFAKIWRHQAEVLLRHDADIPTLPMSSFSFGLQPRPGMGELPYLCWRDGLLLALDPPHIPAAISRTLAAFGQVLAPLINISPTLSASFGAACGYFVSGIPSTSDGQEACDLTAAALRQANFRHVLTKAESLAAAEMCAKGVMSDAFWHNASPLLLAMSEIFLSWTSDPSSYAALRAAWRRGREIELSGG